MANIELNPPRGTLPVLQYLQPAQLSIDESYQRSTDVDSSRKLINRIARDWDWARSQVIVVARRVNDGGGLYVVDGQHRLRAAEKRGDIQVLPCQIVDVESVDEEAKLFVRLNKERRPINKLDEHRAAVTAGDRTAIAIDAALAEAGLTLARHTNSGFWKPGEIANITGIQAAWREFGAAPAALALKVIAQAFDGQQLLYAGSIYPGIVAAISDPDAEEDGEDFEFLAELTELIGSKSQAQWRKAILLERAETTGLSLKGAAINVITDHWDETLGELLAEELEAA